MAQRRKRTQSFEDLTAYTGCQADEWLGVDPLAVGWLAYGEDFVTGRVPSGFVARLLPFCAPENVVCPYPRSFPCPLCRQTIRMPDGNGRELDLGAGELRVIGDEEIFAAPTLLPHYIEAHGYRPPDEFIAAVRRGPQPDSAEFRALIRALQMG